MENFSTSILKVWRFFKNLDEHRISSVDACVYCRKDKIFLRNKQTIHQILITSLMRCSKLRKPWANTITDKTTCGSTCAIWPKKYSLLKKKLQKKWIFQILLVLLPCHPEFLILFATLRYVKFLPWPNLE